MVVKAIPSFDPNPSLKAAVQLLNDLGITEFALIGRVATWLYLPEDAHQFTKDVDIAILTTKIASIEAALKTRGYQVYQLSIGGVAVREPDFFVDFIDRRVDGLDRLFSKAIQEARQDVVFFNEAIPVVGLHHLITMKMVSGEPKDDFDAKALLRVAGVQYSKLRKLVGHFLGMGSANRLDVFAREVGLLSPKAAYRREAA